MRRVVVIIASLLGVFLLMQLVPYRITNPSTRREPAWNSPQTRALVVAACFDCHRNETKAPWYGKIAPMSWWLNNHVEDGRRALNFSEWPPQNQRRARRAAETVQRGSMPPPYYTWFGLHSKAKLSPAQRTELINGLEATFGPPLPDRNH
jgi:hypothetical protein